MCCFQTVIIRKIRRFFLGGAEKPTHLADLDKGFGGLLRPIWGALFQKGSNTFGGIVQ